MSDKKIGFLQATALVTGNMIGSGIFLLPTSLAVFGYFSLWGWLISTIGAILLATVFARLSRLMPITGGPYAYTQQAFGKTTGFFVAWGYWICVWTGNAAIVIAFVSNLSPFFPILGKSPVIAAICSIITVWLLTWLNIRGVQKAARFQLITTIFKLLPILLIGTVGFLYFKPENFFIRPLDLKFPDVFFETAALTLWSFLGIESATIPAAHIRNPEKNIPRATLTGTLISAVVFVLSCTAVIGILPHHIISNSASPFSDAANAMWGQTFYYVIAATAAIACLGTLNGWILLQGQVAWAAANEKVFPPFFLRTTKNQTPISGLIVSSVLTTLLIFFNYSATLQQQFQNMILLSTLSTLIPYAFCSVAELIILKKRGIAITWRNHKQLIFISAFALIFSIGAIIGTGPKTILYGLLLLALGLPFYFWGYRKSLSIEELTK
ncbi:Arginine/agmatine antiporter [compost metagenome]